MEASNPQVENLEEGQCWRYLASQAVGRLAVGAERIEIFPVNYRLGVRRVYFISGAGTKVDLLSNDGRVAFEVDGGDDAGTIWSVVIHGRVRSLESEREIDSSGLRQLRTWYPSEKTQFLVISPDEVSGRRFHRPAGWHN